MPNEEMNLVTLPLVNVSREIDTRHMHFAQETFLLAHSLSSMTHACEKQVLCNNLFFSFSVLPREQQ